MIILEDVCRDFTVGDSIVHALRDINLTITPGDYISIMGPSGSGKSTLLNILGLLDRPDRGQYHLNGTLVSELDDDALAQVRRERVGFVFQFFHLIPRLSAADNIALPLTLAGSEPTQREARVKRALEQLGLGDRADHRPDQLSGGQRQRVAIARAMITEPEMILADEPTGNLDRNSGREVIETLETLNRDKGITLVVVTHDPEIGQRARRRIHMIDGRITEDYQQ